MIITVRVCLGGGGAGTAGKLHVLTVVICPTHIQRCLDSNTFNRTRNKRLQLKYLFKIDPSQAIVLCQLRVNVKKYWEDMMFSPGNICTTDL